jgi:hypothetical protein
MRMNRTVGFLLVSVLAVGASVGIGTANASQDCVAIQLGFGQKSVEWSHFPLSKLKRDTVYTLVETGGQSVLHAEADSSVSFYGTRLEPPVEVPKTLTWRWKTDALVPGADNRDQKREDAPLRVIVAFSGDVKKLPEPEQKRFSRAKKLSGRTPPFATLMYVWSEQVPVDTVISSAHTSQVKMLVVASGTKGLGAWQTVRRNLDDDYRKAFGNAPGRVIGIAVMTDTDNTGTKASGAYADIEFTCRTE